MNGKIIDIDFKFKKRVRKDLNPEGVCISLRKDHCIYYNGKFIGQNKAISRMLRDFLRYIRDPRYEIPPVNTVINLKDR